MSVPIICPKYRLAIVLPTKSGANNALIAMAEKSGAGKLVMPRHDLTGSKIPEGYKIAMPVCNPYSRLVSMYRHLIHANGSWRHLTDFSEFIDYHQRKWGKNPNRGNWLRNLTQIHELIQPDVIVYSEDMYSALHILYRLCGIQLKSEDAGIHWATYRHRKGWKKQYGKGTKKKVANWTGPDCENFNYPRKISGLRY